MVTKFKNLVIGGLMVFTIAFASSCQKEVTGPANEEYASILNVMPDGTSTLIEPNLKSGLLITPDLTDSELASLLKMKEEEKLARDVYSALYKKWGSQIFSKIAAAENNHLNAIILLLENYGEVTTAGAAGQFTDPEVQALYNELVSAGSATIADAYKTGALIEEMDIKDLVLALNSTSNENIIMVFENLYKGSRNHLRAFNRELAILGIEYTPIFISQDEYSQIVNSAMEKGKQYNMNGKNGKGLGSGKKGQARNGSGICNN